MQSSMAAYRIAEAEVQRIDPMFLILPFRVSDSAPAVKRRSASVGAILAATQAEDDQGKFVSLLRRMQRRKERGHIRSIRGILGLGILSLIFGAATVIVETIKNTLNN
ncbi:hypothetical protein RvY_13780 [Ramazzottius varieornatus]|uniref:Uncharacterized protein n=1 Tax=Ramazzottius varieornatus TaxID=947166 RepID=A0A1D1VP23_RAMVA|nr:hypothetical protein RvY_13780 [Ramazzottius varieornatus]